jgi:beta-glucoside operon transcriptional antiterminator
MKSELIPVVTIKKVLNSGVILVVDEAGQESILLGKGIGYGQKAGTPVPSRDSDQVFISLSNPDVKNLVDLLTAIPADYVEITTEIVRHAEGLGMKLHPHIYLALTDHLHFAVQRTQQGLPVVNRLAWEVKTFYPREYAVGLFGLTRLRERVAVDLPEEEAANIAFHVANAENGPQSTYDALRAVKIIDAVVTIVRYSMGIELLNDSLHFSRFIIHMQFFVGRLMANRMLISKDDFLFHQVSTRYPKARNAAERVRSHIVSEYDTQLPNEEVAYLTLHIERLTTG